VLGSRIFHTIIRITNRTMSIFRAKRYSSAPAMLKPERKSPSMPTVEMLSPSVISAVHDEIIFDPLKFNYLSYHRQGAGPPGLQRSAFARSFTNTF
jgi:hypothetical protein